MVRQTTAHSQHGERGRALSSRALVAALVVLHLAVLGPIALLGLHLATGNGASRGRSAEEGITVHKRWDALLAAATQGADGRVDGRREHARRQLGGSGGGGSGGHDDGHGGGSHSLQATPLLAAFGTLALGAFILSVLPAKLGIPYTVILLAGGMVLGGLLLVAEQQEDPAWAIGVRALQGWASLDAHLMLNIFLPPLIFESAFAMEWRVFWQCKLYCVFLAFPCMLAATYATGALANLLLMPGGDRYFTLPYSITGVNATDGNALSGTCASDAWSAEAGNILGVVLSATDPVAVVALLKELGLGGLLPVSIEGESLLNDGTALVVFYLFRDTLRGAKDFCTAGNASEFPCAAGSPYVPSEHWFTPLEVVAEFSRGAFVGLAFGLAMGIVLTTWMRSVYNDANVVVSLNIAFAYLTFFLSEMVESSGVLAVVALGLWMSRKGRTQISSHVEEFLTEFWEMLAYFGNTLIFVITGIIVVYDLGNPDVEADAAVDWGKDVPHLLAIYGWCLLVRWGLVTVTYALFNWSGLLHLEWKWSLITMWGGLRGAVGLGLAMMVFKDPDICPHIRTRVMFHSAGLVLLTVVINGTSMRYLIKYLGMAEMAPSKQLVFTRAIRAIEAKGRQREKLAMRETVFASTIWEESRRYYLTEADMRASTPPAKANGAEGGGGGGSRSGSPAAARPPDKSHTTKRGSLMRTATRAAQRVAKPNNAISEAAALEVELRRRILLMCKRSYFNQLEEGMINRDAAQYLRQLSDGSLTSEHAELDEWQRLEDALSSFHIFSGLQLSAPTRVAVALLKGLADCAPFLLGWCHYGAVRMEVSSVELRHNVLLGFLNAREEAVESVPKLLGEIEVAEGVDVDLGRIVENLQLDVGRAYTCLQDLQESHFEAYSSIATVIAARAVLHKQLVTIDHLAHEGLLDTHEVIRLSGSVKRQMKSLVQRPPVIPLPNAMDALRQVPWLQHSSDATLTEVLESSFQKRLEKGEVLIDAGDARDAVYIVMRGLLISERGDPAAAGGTGGPSSDASGHHHAPGGAHEPVGGVRGAQHAQHAQQGEPSRARRRRGGDDAHRRRDQRDDVGDRHAVARDHHRRAGGAPARHPRRHPPQGRRGPPGD